MNREKKKSASTLQGKQGVIRTQKVSLCLVPSKHFNSNHKAASFCQNLNIKYKTTKSSPEKTIIKDQNYNNPSKNQNDSNMNSINKEIEKISDDFMKRKLIKKQIETKGKILFEERVEVLKLISVPYFLVIKLINMLHRKFVVKFR